MAVTDFPVDPLFRVDVIQKTPYPNQAIYAAMRQDHCSDYVYEFHPIPDDERECGRRVVKHLLNGHKGHYGVIEHPQIILSCGYFPHSVMQQLRTHRVGISFDVQSFRFTSTPIEEIGRQVLTLGHPARKYADLGSDLVDDIERTFYLRPEGEYQDPESGEFYTYSKADREEDILSLACACDIYYCKRIDQRMAKEHARDLIPFCVRQHFTVSLNMRSLMHLLQIRSKKDAQLEVRQWCDLVLPHFQEWSPEIYDWFMDNLYIKGKLAP